MSDIFESRTHTRVLDLAAHDHAEHSRIGGSPPAILGESPPICGGCGKPYLYVLTLEADLLGDVAEGSAYSLLVCGGSCAGRDNDIGVGTASTVLRHAPSPRGPARSWQWAKSGRALVAHDPSPEDPTAPSKLSKIGGHVGFAQDEDPPFPASMFVAQIADDFGVMECGGLLFLLGGSGGWYLWGDRPSGVLTFASPRGLSQI